MTRNAVVVSPHPLAREVCADAARHAGAAAVAAGAPDGCIQVVEEPTIPLIEALMSDPTTDVILATGGAAGRARRLPVGQPGHRRRPRQRAGAGRLTPPTSTGRPGGWWTPRRSTTRSCAPTSRARSSRSVSPTRSCASWSGTARHVLRRRGGRPPCGPRSTPTAGCAPTWSARTRPCWRPRRGIQVPPRTRVLVAPFPLVVPEEPLAREKLFPLLGLVAGARRRPRHRRGAGAMLRIGGAGHSAVIHSSDPRDDHGLRRGRAGAAGGRQRRRQHRHRPASTPTWRRP